MSANSYMTIDASNVQKLAALDTVVTPIVNTAVDTKLSTGIEVLKITDQLKLSGDVVGPLGGMRLHDSSPTYIEYTTDGGVTWKRLDSVTIDWRSGVSYVSGDAVLHNGAWYVCTEATSSAEPGSVTQWRLLTDGKFIYHVSTADQLSAALQLTASSIEIKMHGAIAGTVSATVTAGIVVIHSDESATFSGSLSITASANANIYWHCLGTYIDGTSSVAVASGTLWIERLAVSGSLALSTNIKYQQITGTVTGSAVQVVWTLPVSQMSYVPLDISAMASMSFNTNDVMYVYHDAVTYGKISINTLMTQFASDAAKYWHVDGQGTLAQRPATATVGYLYYATDTGDLYRMGNDNVWDAGVHIQGPAGVSPTVTVTSITGGHKLTITDIEHPQGQAVDVMDGQDGQDGASPSLAAGTTETLTPGTPAYAEVVPSTTVENHYVVNFGIPKGDSGLGANIVGVYPITVNKVSENTEIAIEAYPELTAAVGTSVQTIKPGRAYNIYPAVTTLELKLDSEHTESVGECWVRVLFGTYASVVTSNTVKMLDSPFPEQYNILHIIIWEGTMRIRIVDHYYADQDVAHAGHIRVMYPTETIPEGAAWSTDNGATWNLFGDTLSLPISNQSITVTFKSITGYTSPADIRSGLLDNQLITVVCGAYSAIEE